MDRLFVCNVQIVQAKIRHETASGMFWKGENHLIFTFFMYLFSVNYNCNIYFARYEQNVNLGQDWLF